MGRDECRIERIEGSGLERQGEGEGEGDWKRESEKLIWGRQKGKEGKGKGWRKVKRNGFGSHNYFCAQKSSKLAHLGLRLVISENAVCDMQKYFE
jgi:hypothetical protein